MELFWTLSNLFQYLFWAAGTRTGQFSYNGHNNAKYKLIKRFLSPIWYIFIYVFKDHICPLQHNISLDPIFCWWATTDPHFLLQVFYKITASQDRILHPVNVTLIFWSWGRNAADWGQCNSVLCHFLLDQDLSKDFISRTCYINFIKVLCLILHRELKLTL